jgi:hypothetical protein
MAQIFGFRLKNTMFSMLPPFFCLDCIEALSREKGWGWKEGPSRKAAVPVVEFSDGLARYLRVPASNFKLQMKTGEWPIMDADLGVDEEFGLYMYMSSLGLRIIPSMPQPIELNTSCKHCGVGVVEAPAELLSATLRPA